MKAFLISALSLVLSAFVGPATAAAITPAVAAVSADAVRPLLRFLVASLQLPDYQALAVSRILQVEGATLLTASPDELAAALAPVLTPEQLVRFRTLAPAPDLSRDLHYLAALR